ncbi:MAG: alpha/beta hydrolase [Saprospiraceae bacterium]|nr:alpha/beta hydrolase [Saprospiraceae bacterium]
MTTANLIPLKKNELSKYTDSSIVENQGSIQNRCSQFRIQNNETQLSVTMYERKGAETIFLLHGGPGVPNAMKPIVKELHKKYQLVYFEQRGTGKSVCSNDSFTIEDYISDIHAISTYLQLDSFHLFGHSWGGLYAQLFADKCPSMVKSLFLCSPSSGTNKTWKETEMEVFNFNRKKATHMEWLKMGWYSLLGNLGSSNAYRKLFKLVYAMYDRGWIETQIDEEELDFIFAAPINKTRKEILKYAPLSVTPNPSFPICITYGEKDVYGESRNQLIERYPTAQLHIIEQSGHIPWSHNPVQFNKILDVFYHLRTSSVGNTMK